MSIESVIISNHLILCHPLLLLPSIFPSIRVFAVSQLFASGCQRIGASASASVLSVNIQGWFTLVLTGLISLQSKGLVFNCLHDISPGCVSGRLLSKMAAMISPKILCPVTMIDGYMCSLISNSATQWTVARQAPLSMEFSGKNTGVDCHFFLQRIFLTQGSNPCLLCLLHFQADSLPLSHLGSPWALCWYSSHQNLLIHNDVKDSLYMIFD